MLIIAADLAFGAAIKQDLDTVFLKCDLVPCPEDAAELLRRDDYTAIIFDVGTDPSRMLAWLGRRPLNAPPVMALTGGADVFETVAALDAGADDALPKPIELHELAARLRAIGRRPAHRDPVSLRVGDLHFDPATRIARFGEQPLRLARRESDLLHLLMHHSGTLVRRSAIQNALYDFDETASDNAIEASVSRLRRALAAAGAPAMLITMRGLGYVLRSGSDANNDRPPEPEQVHRAQ